MWFLKIWLIFSGGYNIKTGPGCSIELMKFDMGGSAAVLGAAKAIGQIKPPGVEVSQCIIIFRVRNKLIDIDIIATHCP